MDYLKIKQSYYTEHNFTFTDSTRDWFLVSDDEKIRKWRVLYLVRFYGNSEILPLDEIDLIEIENYSKEPFDYDLIMPEGRLIDFFSIGISYFVSHKLMSLFVKNGVESCFSEALIKIDGVVFDEPYYLFSPKDMLDVFDKESSVFTTEIDLGGEEVVSEVGKYCLDYGRIPSDQKLFYLLLEGKISPLMIRDDIARIIIEENITGIDFIKVEDM